MLLLLFCMISLVQTALALEWQLYFERDITINENVDVTVTQGAASGTLKIALTGKNQKVYIETAAEGITFRTDADLVIGSTTVESEDIFSAKPFCLESYYKTILNKVSVDCICWSPLSYSEGECKVDKGHTCEKSTGQCYTCGPGTFSGISHGGAFGAVECYSCDKGVSQNYYFL